MTLKASALRATTALALAAAFATLSPSAHAQISPAIKPGTTPIKVGPSVKAVRIDPQVHRIAGRATTACGTLGIIFEKGVTPALTLAPTAAAAKGVTAGGQRPAPAIQTGQVAPYAEVLGGANGDMSALQFIGPMMENIRRAELIIGNGPAREVPIITRHLPSGQCAETFGTNNGAITVSLPLPDVSVQTRAKVRLFGFGRTLAEGAAGGRLCFLDPSLGIREAVPCGNIGDPSGPVPLAQEIELVIKPHPRIQQVIAPSSQTFTGSNVRVGGRLQVRGVNFEQALFPDQRGDLFSSATQISRTGTEWTGDVFLDFPSGAGISDVNLTVKVPLMRRDRRTEVEFWDTALENNGRIYRTTRSIRFERRGAAQPPPAQPPAAAQATIDGFDPGNLLYITTGGTTTVGNRPGESDQVLTALASQQWCAAVPQPAPAANGDRTVALGQTALGPINWGIRNRGNAAFNGAVTAELRLGGQTVDRMTFNGALQPGETRQQAFRRPTAQARVARESLGPVCYHVGLDSDPVVENRGYTIHIVTPGNETERLQSRN